MPISKFVAASFNRPLSVAMRILPSTGSVERVATARPTTDKPLARFSWRQLTFMETSEKFQIYDFGFYS
jgi:hypothetical protein